MKIKVRHLSEISDEKFRCFYLVIFKTASDFNQFVDKLQHSPKGWIKTVAWTCTPKSRSAEAYVEISKEKKEEILIEISEFLNKEPKLNWFQKALSAFKKPYWKWKTRHLKIK